MSRYTPRSYDTGGSRRYESSLRSYDTESSYKSYDSGRRYDTGRTYDSGRSYGSSSTSTSTTSGRYASPTSSSRSYTSNTTSTYSPTTTRSYTSGYSSRNGNTDSSSSRLTRASSTKTSDGTSSPTLESRYSRNGYSSPRSSISSRTDNTSGRSPRASLSSEPSLEIKEDTESRWSHRRRSDSDDSKDPRPYSKYSSRSYSNRDTRTDSDKDSTQDESKSRYKSYRDRKFESDSNKERDKEERSYSRYTRRHTETDSDASDTKKYESRYDTESDLALRREERRRLRIAKREEEEANKQRDGSKEDVKAEKSESKEDALKEWRRKRALQQSSLSSEQSEDKPDVSERFSRRDWKKDLLKESTDDSDSIGKRLGERKRFNASEEKDSDSSTKESTIQTRSSFRRLQREKEAEKQAGKDSDQEKLDESKDKESDSLSLGSSTRAERIAKYKEERRKELAAISNLTKQLDSDSDLTVKPSLFITASSQRQSSEERSEDGRPGTSSDTGGQTHRRRLPDIPVSKQSKLGSHLASPDADSKSKSEISSDSGISENEARFRKYTSLDTKLTAVSVRRASSLKGDKTSPSEANRQSSSKSREETRTKSRSRDRLDAEKSKSTKSIRDEDDGSRGIKDRTKGERTSSSKSVRRSQSDVSRASHNDPNADSSGSESPRGSTAIDQLKMKQIARRGDLLEKKSFGSKEIRTDTVTKKAERAESDVTLSPLKTPTKMVRGQRMPLSPDPLDDLLQRNAAFLSDGDVESELGSSSSTASRSIQGEGSKTRKSLRRRHLQKSLSKKSSVDDDAPTRTKWLSKEVEDEDTSHAVSARREQTALSRNNTEEDNTHLEVNITLDATELSGGLGKEDTQMKKSGYLRHHAELDSSDGGKMERRRRFITRNMEAVKDSDSIVSTESESVFETAPSAPSSAEPVRRKVRKDKSSLRKSSLNKTDDDNSSKIGSVDSASDRGDDKGPSSITISRIARDEPKKTSSEDSATQPLRAFSRTKDISSLIQKFSSSDASSSEKSDTETNVSRRRMLPIRRQDPVVISSTSASDESNTESSRRTPERSQSLRMNAASSSDKNDSKVQRAGSFKSDFMRRRFNSGDSDKPSPELADVLNKRSNIVEKQEEEYKQKINGKEDSKYERADQNSAAEVDEVIADSEVAAVLKARRKQTDSAGSEEQTKDNESNSHHSFNISLDPKSSLKTLDASLALLNRTTEDLDSPATLSSDSEILASVPRVSTRKRSSQETISEAEQLIKNVETSITSRISNTVSDLSKEENVSELTIGNYTSTSETKGKSDSVGDTADVFVIQLPESKRDSEEADFAMPLDEKWVTDRRKGKHNRSSPVKAYSGHTNGDLMSKTDEFDKLEIRDSAKKSGNELGAFRSVSEESVSVECYISPSSSLRRTESLKDNSIKRTESFERRKGILKRTPSLPKQPSRPIVDPELAERLRKQREKENDLSDEDKDKPTTVSVIEEIQEQARKEKKEDEDEDSDSGGVKLSVLERISKMENKMEEEKHSSSISSRSRSGFVTPKSAQKGWVEKSNSETSFDRSPSRKHVSGEQLMEKLSLLAERSDTMDLAESQSVSERRQKFQRRSRDDWRTRTQPVTVEEIHAADNLETVSSFRAEVRKNTMISAFNQLRELDKKLSPLGKKTEYPQHIAMEKRRRNRSQRHKTTPVTAAELGAIPEGECAQRDPLRSKGYFQRDSTTDSGILSGSDADSVMGRNSSESLRSLTLEFDLNEDDPARLSVSAKTSIFKTMEQKTKAERDRNRPTASGAKRYIDRKKRERSLTQPVTEDEVKTAAEISDPAEEKPKVQNIPRPHIVNRAKSVEPEDSSVAEEDELVGLSLAEKVKLFTQKREEKNTARQDAPVPRRRARKNISRYSTQPVTIEEVEKAASMNKVSPLAASLIKPPDPELLKGLPISAQRELMAQHAEACLSQPNSRPSSRPGSRRGSSHDLEDESKEGVRSILKQDSSRQSPEPEVRSILKTEKDKKDSEPKGILKHEMGEAKIKGDETRSILKHSEAAAIVSTTKTNSEPEQKQDSSEPRGILKTDGQEGTESHGSSEVKSALKKDAKGYVPEPRGILKKEGSFEIRKSEPEKSVLKDSRDDQGQNVRSILKKEPNKEESSTQENGDAKFYIDEDSDQETTSTEVVEGTSTKRRPRQGDRYLTQPADLNAAAEKSPQSRRKYKYEGRHLTQPITPEEMKEAEAVSTPQPVKLGGSIGDRLNALKKSGEEDWRRRVPKQLDFDTPVKLRDKTHLSNLERPSSIADRLSQLDESKGGWKERVEEKDQEQFTVKGRLGRTGSFKESPLVARLRQTPKKHGVTADPSSNGPSPVSSPTSPSKEFAVVTKKIALPKEIISGPAPVKTEREKQAEEEDVKEPVKVAVPQIDIEALDSFFHTKDIDEITEKIEVDIDDFNEIFIRANEMLPSVRRARPARSKSMRSRNHLKTRSLHLDLKDEYLEINRGVAEKEFKRMKKETLAKDAGFAQEALAGLASKENFSKVALKKAQASTPGGTQNFQPFKDLMLLHVKGRRQIQTRLVEPSATSINSGDCYVLVTRDKIINWVGDFCNVIERARSADIAAFIQQKKDLGCKIGTVQTVEESKKHLGAGKHFWAAIGGQKEYQGCGPDEEDELYESYIIRTNMVYRLVDNSLIPYEEYWGCAPKFEMLQKDEVLVFDFGSEMYVWQGKTVSMDRRKMGLKLARKLWERGYDYEDCDINPLSPLADEDSKTPNKSNERPPWALFGKVNQNMETILFREKFADWPDSSRLIKVKDIHSPSQKTEVELQPYDAKLMIPLNKAPVTLLLEGSHVGRGTKWFEDMEGFIREVDILTLGVSVWHVMEYDHYQMPESSYGQFHEGDTYVVRWQYMIANAGMKTLKGQAARHSLTGRERCAYFFWQGKQSTINEQGASALMTVELDEERGPQVRVVQGKELPCFLNLFEGRMMVHIGKREDASTNTQGSWRFYCVRGEFSNETSLVEIPLCTDNLRSRSSFILLSVKTGLVYIWHGAKSPQHTRDLAVKAVNNLKEKCPLEVGLDERASFLVTEMDEGLEKSEFWGPLGGRPRGAFISLLSDPKPYDYTVRLFYMCSVSGVFKVTEILYEGRTSDLVSPFPFLQADLYNESITQPALFLVDNHHEVYLWQGWWPVGDEEQENVATGSARARFDIDRRCAMHTTIQYCQEKDTTKPPTPYLVSAGVEPKSFTNLFPYWQVDESVAELAKLDGKIEDSRDLVSDVLDRLSKTVYTLDELLERPLPEGVDPSKLEWYLDDDTFQDMFEMTKDEFYGLPNWKQKQLKQPTGLY